MSRMCIRDYVRRSPKLNPQKASKPFHAGCRCNFQPVTWNLHCDACPSWLYRSVIMPITRTDSSYTLGFCSSFSDVGSIFSRTHAIQPRIQKTMPQSSSFVMKFPCCNSILESAFAPLFELCKFLAIHSVLPFTFKSAYVNRLKRGYRAAMLCYDLLSVYRSANRFRPLSDNHIATCFFKYFATSKKIHKYLYRTEYSYLL